MAKRYIIYSLSDCNFCTAAKELLEENNIDFYNFNLDNDHDFLLEVKEYYNHRTVPIVIENNKETGNTKFVGGFNELSEVLNAS